MTQFSFSKWVLCIASISFLNVGCQGNLQTGTSLSSKLGDNTPLATPEDVSKKVDLKSVEDAVVQSKTAMDEAKIQLDKFSNADGSIKIWSLLSIGSSQTETQSLFFIAEKLSVAFDKIVDAIKMAKGKFGEARAKLATEAAKLDPARPEHHVILAEIQRLMLQIDTAESQFTVMIQTLASRLDLVNRGIDMLVASASAANPIIGALLPILTGQVKMAISDFQMKLRAL